MESFCLHRRFKPVDAVISLMFVKVAIAYITTLINKYYVKALIQHLGVHDSNGRIHLLKLMTTKCFNQTSLRNYTVFGSFHITVNA